MPDGYIILGIILLIIFVGPVNTLFIVFVIWLVEFLMSRLKNGETRYERV
jgi:hypothetical protein